MNNTHQFDAPVNASITSATRGTARIAFESSIFVLINIAALVGNSLVCLALFRNPSLRTVTNYFVLSLALADLSMAALVMPLSVISSVANKWIAEDFGCQVSGFLSISLGGISLLTVMLLAINRYFRVVRPALYTNIFSKKRSVAMAICPWILTLSMATVSTSIASLQLRTFTIQPAACFAVNSGTNALLCLSSVSITIPGLVTAICYVKIYQTIRHHNTAAAPSSHGGHSAYGVEEAKITRIMTIVVVGFYLCWLLVLSSTMLWTLITFKGAVIKYYNFYYTFPLFASSVINPFVYGIMSQPFRKQILKILRRER